MTNTLNTLEAGGAQAATHAEQYVSFTLGGEHYGADIRRVQEIKGWDSATRIPNTPKYVLGVVNLRGSVVPVIDLRVRFGLDQAPFESTTVIVVVRVSSERGERTVGVVVDAVNDVHRISADDIRSAPHLSAGADQMFIQGIATIGGKMVILLDIDKLIIGSIMPDGT